MKNVGTPKHKTSDRALSVKSFVQSEKSGKFGSMRSDKFAKNEKELADRLMHEKPFGVAGL